MLKKWGTVDHVVQNYICRKCEFDIDRPPDYQEKPSPEEIEALSVTIDGKPFNPAAVSVLIRKMGMVRRMWKYTKMIVVDEDQLKEYYNKWLEEQAKKQQQQNQQQQQQEQKR